MAQKNLAKSTPIFGQMESFKLIEIIFEKIQPLIKKLKS